MDSETLKTIARKMRDFDFARSRIALRLVSPRREEALLQSLPHLPCMDLAFIFVVFFNREPHAQMTASVRDSHLARWGITPEELFPIAAANSPRCMPPHLAPIEDILGIADGRETGRVPVEETGRMANKSTDSVSGEKRDAEPSGKGRNSLYVLSSRQGIYGAVTMLYPGLLRNFAADAADDLYVIPSSVHEVLLQARSAAPDVQSMNAIIRSINANEVEPEDRLADHVYVYRRTEDLLFDPLRPSASIRPFPRRSESHFAGEIREASPCLRQDRTVSHFNGTSGTAFL